MPRAEHILQERVVEMKTMDAQEVLLSIAMAIGVGLATASAASIAFAGRGDAPASHRSALAHPAEAHVAPLPRMMAAAKEAEASSATPLHAGVLATR
jgi:hypothetical protein